MPEYTYTKIIDVREFVEAANTFDKLGWAVVEQVSDLLNGCEPGELNNNAINYIEYWIKDESPEWVDTEPLTEAIAEYRGASLSREA